MGRPLKGRESQKTCRLASVCGDGKSSSVKTLGDFFCTNEEFKGKNQEYTNTKSNFFKKLWQALRTMHFGNR